MRQSRVPVEQFCRCSLENIRTLKSKLPANPGFFFTAPDSTRPRMRSTRRGEGRGGEGREEKGMRMGKVYKPL